MYETSVSDFINCRSWYDLKVNALPQAHICNSPIYQFASHEPIWYGRDENWRG